MNWEQLRDRIKIRRQKLSRAAPVQALLSRILAAYIRFVYHTSRIRLEAPDSARPFLEGEQNCIFAFWHGRLLMVPPFKPRKRDMFVLISRHNDGELIAQTLAHFGIETVRGSSSKGGSSAARAVIEKFRKGENISITPDGPRGPNRTAQPGVIHLARMCNAPIVPIALSASCHKPLKSWDRMQVALPFGTIAAHVNEPFYVPREGGDEVMEATRTRLEAALDHSTRRADEMAGLSIERSQSSASPLHKKATR